MKPRGTKPERARRAYDFEFFSVRHLPRYGWIIDRSPAAVVVPIAPTGEIWLAKIRRTPTATTSWEFPGGALDGEPPVVAGLRELEEECGLVASGRARVLRTVLELAPGMGTFPHHVVVARGVVPKGKRAVAQAEEGIVAVRKFTRAQVRRMVRAGKISVHATLAALMISGWLDEAE